MDQKQNTAKDICMITAGLIIVACWGSFIYHFGKDNPNDNSAVIFATFITGPIMILFLLSVGHLLEAFFEE